jgi:hypothetical protein
MVEASRDLDGVSASRQALRPARYRAVGYVTYLSYDYSFGMPLYPPRPTPSDVRVLCSANVSAFRAGLSAFPAVVYDGRRKRLDLYNKVKPDGRRKEH